MKIGFIGLGRMGRNMVIKLIEHGHEVVVWNRSSEPIEELKSRIDTSLRTPLSGGEAIPSVTGKSNGIASSFPTLPQGHLLHSSGARNDVVRLTAAQSIEDIVVHLPTPKIIWLMLPQGTATQNILDEVTKYILPNDIVIDGGNSFFKDTKRRFELFSSKGIRFLGIGVAGGIIGPRAGYCMMAGGDKSAYDYITPILDALVQPTAKHGYFGTGGAGHFVKMVHNGIEYGLMQSLAEGFDVLENAPYKYDLTNVGKVWQGSSLVSGFMLDRAVEALVEDPHLEKLSGTIDATGEAEWTIDQAKAEGVAVESIQLALDYRKCSKTDPIIQKSFTARMIAALRNKFGGHKVEKKQAT